MFSIFSLTPHLFLHYHQFTTSHKFEICLNKFETVKLTDHEFSGKSIEAHFGQRFTLENDTIIIELKPNSFEIISLKKYIRHNCYAYFSLLNIVKTYRKHEFQVIY